LLLCSASVHAAVIMDVDWPMPGHDIYHSSCSSASSDVSIPDMGLLHVFEGTGELSSPVASDLDGDGNAEILFGSKDGSLYCITWDARELWEYDAGSPVSAPSVFDLDGDNISEVLFSSGDGKVYLLDNMGRLLWSYRTNDSVSSTPVALNIDYWPELEVLVPSGDRYLYAIDRKGNLVKKYMIADPSLSTVCAGDMNLDGKPDYFMGSYNNRLDAVISPDGRRMTFDTGGPVTAPVYVPAGLTENPG